MLTKVLYVRTFFEIKFIHIISNAVLLFLFHDRLPYYVETSPWIYSASKWTGFYMVGISVMSELIWERIIKVLCIITGMLYTLIYF